MTAKIFPIILLILSVIPVFMGTGLAFGDGIEHFPSALILLLGTLMLQFGVTLPKEMEYTKALCYLSILPVCIYITYRVGNPPGKPLAIIIGLTLIILGTINTLGQYKLKSSGIQLILTFLFFGPLVVSLTYFTQSLEMNWAVFLSGFGPGLLAVAIFVAKQFRDYEHDNLSGENTLLVKWGRERAILLFLCSLLGSVFIPIIIFFITQDHLATLLTSLTVFMAAFVIKNFITAKSYDGFHKTIYNLAYMAIIYSILFVTGWIL